MVSAGYLRDDSQPFMGFLECLAVSILLPHIYRSELARLAAYVAGQRIDQRAAPPR